MRKILLAFVLLLTTLIVQAQVVTLTFTGKDGQNKTIKLQTIRVSNVTKGWNKTLSYPDTTLTMGTTGVEEFEKANTLRLNQNVPNPFEGVTDVALQTPKTSHVSLEITDMNGRTIVETNKSLPAGTHHFRISLSTAGIYLLTARCDQQMATIKLANQGQVGQNAIQHIGTESLNQQIASLKGDSKEVTDKPFTAGDQMRYSGTAYISGVSCQSKTIEKQQYNSETINLQFDEIDLHLPKVITLSVSNITLTSALCSGYISDDGGKAVTARGICWSKTNTTPTLNETHSLDGTDIGTFSHQLTNLEERTTYYVRAYATNSDGTAYGDVLSFTTLGGAPCANTPTVTDRDGNTYKTIQLGEQCWMKENLRTTKYADGTSIAEGKTSASTTTGYWYYPNNNADNKSSFGLLYNWKAVMRNESSSSVAPSGVQGICPNGWHVPSYREWFQLITYLGTQSEFQCTSAVYSFAKAIASTEGWKSNSAYGVCSPGQKPETNNASGFSLIPAGNTSESVSYFNFGTYAFLWAATKSGSGAYRFQIECNSELPTLEASSSTIYGCSVRCVRN